MKNFIPLVEGRSLFGADVEAYQEGRPDYPPQVYSLLKNYCSQKPIVRVLEIGPGTGLVTQHLLEMGCQVTVVEPDNRFAATLINKFKPQYSEFFTVINDTFEDVNFHQEQFDLVVAATSFHWIDPNIGLEKVFRLLCTNGWFGMWWSIFDDLTNSDNFKKRTSHLFEELNLSPSRREGKHRPFGLQTVSRTNELIATGFKNILVKEHNWVSTMDSLKTRSLFATFSAVAQLSVDERIKFLDEITRIVDEEFGGIVERNFTTIIYYAQKPMGYNL